MLRVAIYSIMLVCSVFASPAAPGGRIVGGRDADISEYPYQVSLFYEGSHDCGGSIIRPNIILTAAHCVISVNNDEITIVAGQTVLSKNTVGVPVSQMIIHENYISYKKDYDVAIVVLEKNLDLNSQNMKQIELAKELPAAGTTVTATGWGRLEQQGLFPAHLQSVNVSFVDLEVCKQAYAILTERMLCAGVASGGKDACQGDSGGPLVVGDKLLGIVSWGTGCALEGYPGVYASVPELYDWIEEHANAYTI